MIKYCIFDLDGTLLNTIKSITHFVNRTFDNFNIPKITEDEAKLFVGNGAKKLILRATNSRGIYDEELIDRILLDYNSSYDRDPFYLTEIYSGVDKTLKKLKERGVKLAVLSNKPHPTTVQVIEKFFPNTFDVVFGGREGIPLKPNPTSAIATAELLGANLGELSFIGDTAVDIMTGKNLGAKLTIGCSWGFRSIEELKNANADVIVSSAEELFSVLTE